VSSPLPDCAGQGDCGLFAGRRQRGHSRRLTARRERPRKKATGTTTNRGLR
jgi:hypothetical protein